MTDKELIKALKCCTTVGGCRECPVLEKCKTHQLPVMGELANDLIARQQEKIERLEKELTKEQLRKEMLRLTVDEIRIQAIKEFAERLKMNKRRFHYLGVPFDILKYAIAVEVKDIDSLVREMEREQE